MRPPPRRPRAPHSEKGRPLSDEHAHNVDLAFAKLGEASDEQRMVWGWASVSTIKDSLITDLQDDVITADELVKMATDFMEDVRTAKTMHAGDQIGTVIHSMPLTKELAESLGIDLDQEGWVVGVKIYDDDTWARVKSGELGAFSIGGRAERVPL